MRILCVVALLLLPVAAAADEASESYLAGVWVPADPSASSQATCAGRRTENGEILFEFRKSGGRMESFDPAEMHFLAQQPIESSTLHDGAITLVLQVSTPWAVDKPLERRIDISIIAPDRMRLTPDLAPYPARYPVTFPSDQLPKTKLLVRCARPDESVDGNVPRDLLDLFTANNTKAVTFVASIGAMPDEEVCRPKHAHEFRDDWQFEVFGPVDYYANEGHESSNDSDTTSLRVVRIRQMDRTRVDIELKIRMMPPCTWTRTGMASICILTANPMCAAPCPMRIRQSTHISSFRRRHERSRTTRTYSTARICDELTSSGQPEPAMLREVAEAVVARDQWHVIVYR